MSSLRCVFFGSSVLSCFLSDFVVFLLLRQEAKETRRARIIRPDPFLLNQIKLTHEHIVTIAKIGAGCVVLLVF